MGGVHPLRDAWDDSATGPGGFYQRTSPREHFRTSATDPDLVAEHLAGLLVAADHRLGEPRPFTVIDIGAGDGRLLESVRGAVPSPLRDRIEAIAIDVRGRPRDLDPAVGWLAGAAPECLPEPVIGVLLAFEWLDDVPCDVVVDGRVLMDDGSLGPSADPADLAWIDRWWPNPPEGHAIEVGRARDRAWRAACRRLRAGTSIAVDYGHLLADRDRIGPAGTLAAYSGGRRRDLATDGTVNLTAHVAIDSLAAAIDDLGTVTVSRQRDELSGLATPASASTLADLQRAGRIAVLRDPEGLGSHWWVRLDR